MNRKIAAIGILFAALTTSATVTASAAQANPFAGTSASGSCHYHQPGIYTNGYWHCGKH